MLPTCVYNYMRNGMNLERGLTLYRSRVEDHEKLLFLRTLTDVQIVFLIVVLGKITNIQSF